MSPPCSTWSRAVSANRIGPKPVRSREFPPGFPWLKVELKEKAELGTLQVMRCAEVLETAPKTTVCLWQHAEDLGRAAMGSQLAFGSLNPSARWQSDDRWRPLPSADAPTGRTTPNQLGSLAMRTGSYSWVSMDGPPSTVIETCSTLVSFPGLVAMSTHP